MLPEQEGIKGKVFKCVWCGKRLTVYFSDFERVFNTHSRICTQEMMADYRKRFHSDFVKDALKIWDKEQAPIDAEEAEYRRRLEENGPGLVDQMVDSLEMPLPYKPVDIHLSGSTLDINEKFQGSSDAQLEANMIAIKKENIPAMVSGWIKCADRMPTKKDADEHGEIMWLNKRPAYQRRYIAQWNAYFFYHEENASHWMPLPALPLDDALYGG